MLSFKLSTFPLPKLINISIYLFIKQPIKRKNYIVKDKRISCGEKSHTVREKDFYGI